MRGTIAITDNYKNTDNTSCKSTFFKKMYHVIGNQKDGLLHGPHKIPLLLLLFIHWPTGVYMDHVKFYQSKYTFTASHVTRLLELNRMHGTKIDTVNKNK